MQFHLNGFQNGDPRKHNIAKGQLRRDDRCDVIIVGSGPAGLTLAAQLSAHKEITTRVFEQNLEPLQIGQADGIACRSLEMFEAIGIADVVLRESYWVNETCFWRPNEKTGCICRVDRIQDVEDDLSEFPHVILSQARVHDLLLEKMSYGPTSISPEYDFQYSHIEMTGETEYPIKAHFLTNGGQKEEVIRTKFLVGCDGARSKVRHSIGQKLIGQSALQLWGVMDVLAVTDFPDIRLKCAIQSGDKGSLLIIPREGGYLVRLYIELGELSSGERASEKNITAEMLVKKVKEILAPYSFECLQIPWFSGYEVGQRLCNHFDNAKSNSLVGGFPNIFITGDACHTHSPKAGQGMNVSMADSFNLGWKLAAVLKGQSSEKILTTYTKERQTIAKELIDFDRDMAKLFSSKNLKHKEKNQFQTYFQKFGRYTAGVETCYDKSTLVLSGEHQSLAVGMKIGMRFHSAPVVRLADAKRIQIGHICEADGRWRLFAFAEKNDFGQDRGAISNLVEFLYGDSKSPIQKYTAKGDDCDATVDFRVVFQQRHNEMDISKLPSHLLPKKGRFGLVDYEKIFCSDHKIGPNIFDARGIDRHSGALIIVRPDQYVAAIMPLTDWPGICKFFDEFMIEQD